MHSDGNRIDNNDLSSLENDTELIVCTEKQIQKLLIYFELKRHLSLQNISYLLKINLDVHQSRYKQCMPSIVQSAFLIVFTYDFEQAKRVRNR